MKFASVCVLALATTGGVQALKGQIPVVTIDTISSWRPITYVSIPGGSQDIPLLVDTGSSLIALCNNTEIGNIAKPANVYGCGDYGVYPDTPYGWIGDIYNTSLIYGDGTETVTDPMDVSLALISDENTVLCTPYVSGIMGVDLGPSQFYDEPQLLPAAGNCNYTKEGTDCCGTGNASLVDSQFGTTMLTSEDLYTFGLIGLAPGRNNSKTSKSVMAFGETARELVLDSVSAGSASFESSEDYWYTFADNVTFSLTGLDEDVNNNCTEYFGNSDCVQSVSSVILDSGTPQMVLPINGLPENFTSLVIVVDSAELEISYEDMMVLYDMGLLNLAGPDTRAVLGFPTFWEYDIVFDVNFDKISTQGRYGTVTFYERPADEDDDDDAVSTSVYDEEVSSSENVSIAVERSGNEKEEMTQETNKEEPAATSAGAVSTSSLTSVLVACAFYMIW